MSHHLIARIRSWTPSLSRNSRCNRGQATQIDFLNAMVILMFGLAAFFGLSVILLDINDSGGVADDLAGERAGDTLADDLLVSNTSTNIGNSTCTTAFFSMNGDPDCPVPSGSNETAYLHSTLGIQPAYGINVTLQQGRSIQTIDGVDTSIGAPIPTATVISEYQRQITLYNDSTDSYEYYTLYVTIWEE